MSRHTPQHPALERDAAPVPLQDHETAHALPVSSETAIVALGELVTAPPGIRVLVFTARVLDAEGIQIGDAIEHRHSVRDEALAADPGLLDTLVDQLRDTVVTKATATRTVAAQLARHPRAAVGAPQTGVRPYRTG